MVRVMNSMDSWKRLQSRSCLQTRQTVNTGGEEKEALEFQKQLEDEEPGSKRLLSGHPGDQVQ